MPASSPAPAPRIALFGGSFDPVHNGHLAVAAEAVRAAGLDRVVFIPARQSPHKPDKAPGAGNNQRLEMLALATADLPWAEISAWELNQPPPSFSWKTAAHFRNELPRAELFWLLGADQWAVIETWAEPELLRAAMEFLVYPRPPHSLHVTRTGWRWQALHGIHPASATAIRAALAAGNPNPAGLPESVAAYIRRTGLYGTSSDGL